ncbi:MAG: hypothetical protein CFE45_40715, partial [Burkholderiales bacterium PBB5]
WTYHEGIRAYGASFARAFGEWSVGGEVSVRHNTPLTSLGAPEPFRGFFNNNSNPGYAVGKTAHAQVSWLASLGPSFISREASFLGEVAWNTRTSIDKGANFINPLTDKSAASMRLVYSPSYRQVVSGVDLHPTVGMSYTNGLSSALGPGFGVHKGGDMSIGLNATYLNTWFASGSYVHF